jgi:hypothetical protein
MKTGYGINSQGAVALSAATARSILGVKGNAAFGVDWLGYRIGFDGVTASAVPVLVELCYCTFATNSPGTNSTSVTVDTLYGRAIANGFTAASSWTAGNEPTVITPFDEFLLTPNGGVIVKDFPRDRTPDSAVAEGFVIRLTAPATVNVRASMFFERG